MGCLSKIGCATVLVIGGIGAWWYMGGQLPSAVSRVSAARSADGGHTASMPSRIAWADVKTDQHGAPSARVNDALAILSRKDGPAYATLSAADVADLIGSQLQRALPSSASRAQIAIVDDLIRVRADVPLRDLGGGALPGLLGSALSEHDTIEVAGNLEVIHPGLAQFRIRELRVHDIAVPTRLILTVVSAIRRGTAGTVSFESLSNDALPVPLSRTVADIRVARGRVTLYKSTP